MGSLLRSLQSLFTRAQTEAELYQSIAPSYEQNGIMLYPAHLLKKAYRKHPNKLALIAGQKSYTYADVYLQAVEISHRLLFDGIQERDRVALYYENSAEYYPAYFGIWQTGAVIVPVNTFLHENELAHVLSDCEAKAIIVSPSLKVKLEAVQAQHPHLKNIRIYSTEIFEWKKPSDEDLKALEAFVPASLEQNELSVLLYTSGTTGTPKGVMLSARNIMTNALQSTTRFKLYGLAENERFFCVLPLFHVFAQNVCLWMPMLIGATIILVPKIDRKLILDGLRHKPTLFLGVPPLYGLLCLMKNAPLESVKLFVSGADMLPDKIRMGFAFIYGRRICAGYGLSEASPVVSVDQENKARATYEVGKPVVGLTCQIRDEHGQLLKANEIGDLWIKGDNIMIGYYKAPEATAKILQDGWLNTGDLASIDVDGNLAIRGRMKDIIIHKGFNIYPAEVENVLMMHPAVMRAAVVGLDEDLSGQVPVAYVAVRQKDETLEHVLKSLCSSNLASYKVPRQIICLDELPTNATGKIDKKKLVQLHNA